MFVLEKIYSGNFEPDNITQTDKFTGGQFIFIDPFDLPDDEGFDLGASLVMEIPLPAGTVTKDIPLSVVPVDTFAVIPIPYEYYASGYEFFMGFGVTRQVLNVEVFVMTSNVTLESILERCEDLTTAFEAERLREITVDAAIVANQIAQSLNLAALDVILAPVTGGATLALAESLVAPISGLLAAEQLLLLP